MNLTGYNILISGIGRRGLHNAGNQVAPVPDRSEVTEW